MDVIEKKVESAFNVCDVCGYNRGFHNSFYPNGKALKVILVCPECGQRYDVKWTITPGL